MFMMQLTSWALCEARREAGFPGLGAARDGADCGVCERGGAHARVRQEKQLAPYLLSGMLPVWLARKNGMIFIAIDIVCNLQ